MSRNDHLPYLKTIGASLRRLALESIARVVVLVDGRDGNATPSGLPVGEGLSLDLIAALRTTVSVFAELPPVAARDVLDLDDADVAQDDPQERVYLVDRHTHQPTLYVRRLRGHSETEQVLAAAAAAQALRYEHVEHQRRHYSVFLHLPRLFQALRADILAWILGQVEFVRRVQAPEGVWRVGLVDVDGSLLWLQQELAGTMRPAHLEVLNWDILRAPSPVTNEQTGGKWLMIIPASASGEVVRRSIEYASRRRPSSILTLVVIARMEPSHQSFLMRVNKYGSALTRLAFFADFTVRAYPADGVSCPMCLDVARLALLTRLPTDPHGDMARALSDRLMRTRAVALHDDADATGFSGDANDVSRAHLRALYESAEFSVRARRILQQTLETDRDAADRFLELLGVEHGIQHFTATELKSRLGVAFDVVMSRVSEVLWDERPPLELRTLLPAIVHLDEAGFVQASPRLIRTFTASLPDIEEICVQLLLANHRLPTEGEVLQDIATETPAVRLVVQLRELLDERERRASEQRHTISAIERLWSRFARSSQFMDALKRLAAGDDARDDDELSLAIRSALDAWNVEIMPLWAQIATSELWPAIASRHGEIAKALSALTGAVARLRGTLLHSARAHSGRPIVGADSVAIAITLEALTSQIAREMLARLFCNVVNAVADVTPTQLILSDGVRIAIQREIDYTVPPIFCDFDEYSRALAQLIDNWSIYGAGANAQVSLRVYREGDTVVTELRDNFPGEIQEDTEGGTRMARVLCETYGGRFDLRRHGAGEVKAVCIALPVLGIIERRRLSIGISRRRV